MKRSKKFFFLISILLIGMLFAASCATKPAVPATPAPPPAAAAPAPAAQPAAPTVSQEDLDKLLQQAKDLKKKAFDLKLFEVLPDDYKAADAQLTAGQTAYDAKDQTAAKDGLTKAVGMFQDVISKGVVQLAAEKRKAADDMKAAALKEGADQKNADRFGPADQAYTAAAALVDAGKYEDAIGGFDTARVEYEIAYKKTVAGELRQKIADGDFAKWDTGNFQLAENKYGAESGLWASNTDADRQADIDSLDEAILRYNLVVQKGREMVATGAKTKTDDAKARSDSIKADVAVKDLYDTAQSTYNDATTKLASQDYDTATTDFNTATDQFDAAYQEAAKKRAAAQAAMQAADQATAQSQKTAQDADSIVNQPAAQ